MSDVKTERPFLQQTVCHSQALLYAAFLTFPAVFVLSPAHKGTRPHARAKNTVGLLFLANASKSYKTAPILSRGSRQHSSLPRYVAFAGHTAEQRLVASPSQAQRFGTGRFCSTSEANTLKSIGLSPSRGGSTCCCLRLLQPITTRSSGSSQLQDLSSIKEEINVPTRQRVSNQNK